jgi:hypothetical protein
MPTRIDRKRNASNNTTVESPTLSIASIGLKVFMKSNPNVGKEILTKDLKNVT